MSRYLSFSVLSLLIAGMILASGLCLAVAKSGQGGLSRFESYPFSDPAVVLEFYDIKGSNLAELQRAIAEKGPIDQEGIRRDAHVSWRIDWSWPEVSPPDYSELKVRYTIRVRLPRWVDSSGADAELLAKWKRYFDKMVRHEEQHIRHVLDNVADIAKEIKAAAAKDPAFPATSANRIAHDVLRRIRRLDQEYDRRTVHGKLEGVVLQ